MKAATSPHSRYHYSNSLEEEQREKAEEEIDFRQRQYMAQQ